jgi:hypothetical protein
MAKITCELSEAIQNDVPKSAVNNLTLNSHIYGDGKIAKTSNSFNLNAKQMMAGDISGRYESKRPGHTLSANANKLSEVNGDSDTQQYSKQVQA